MTARKLASPSSITRKSLVERGMQASLSARKAAGADLKSPICIYGACEAHGVTVRFNDINMEGMYDRVPKPRVHISALRPLARRVFTCAHELGHHVFGHGSTIDELRDDHLRNSSRPPEEILADAFAAFTLMPTLGLREAFVKRKLDPNHATAEELYAIACNFGVGHATLVNHLAYGIGMITQTRRDSLGQITPKMIRTQMLGEVVPEHLTIADLHWNASTLDTEQGSLLLLPSGIVADTAILMPERNLLGSRLFRAMRPGITRVAIPGTSWATYVRVASMRYVGLARYRHLEEDVDD